MSEERDRFEHRQVKYPAWPTPPASYAGLTRKVVAPHSQLLEGVELAQFRRNCACT